MNFKTKISNAISKLIFHECGGCPYRNSCTIEEKKKQGE